MQVEVTSEVQGTVEFSSAPPECVVMADACYKIINENLMEPNDLLNVLVNMLVGSVGMLNGIDKTEKHLVILSVAASLPSTLDRFLDDQPTVQ